MNITYLIKKNHIFKNRKKNQFSYYNINFLNYKYCNSGIFFSNKTRFEFIYLKTFKKLFKKKSFKKDKLYSTHKFWLTVRPNFLLSMKSKNARMGSGVGSYVRVCYNILANKPFIFFKFYSLQLIKNIIKYLKLKLNINLYMLSTLNK